MEDRRIKKSDRNRVYVTNRMAWFLFVVTTAMWNMTNVMKKLLHCTGVQRQEIIYDTNITKQNHFRGGKPK